MKYRDLIPLLPKYVRKYKDCNVGDVLESGVWICGLGERYRPNDPDLLDCKVVAIKPLAANRFYSARGIWQIQLKWSGTGNSLR